MPLPPVHANAPTLTIGLELYYQAFLDLTSCRPSGFGVCPIPWYVIRDYAETFQFDSDQEDALYYHIRAMDKVFMDYHNEKLDKKK